MTERKRARKRPPGGDRAGANPIRQQPAAITTDLDSLYGKNRPGASAANEEARNARVQPTPAS